MARRVVHARRRRRWPARVGGVLGTAALLGTGAAIALMVVPTGSEEAVPNAPAASSPPEANEKQQRKPKLTAAQRRARAAAAATLAQQGFEPVRLGDYEPGNELRVLIGRPADDDAGDRRAFFFARREFIAYDADSASGKLRVVRAGNRTVTLRYGVYDPGDRRCCPRGGTARVRFRWDGETLAPQDEIPSAVERVPSG